MDEQPRPFAPGDEQVYSLTVEDAANLYKEAGFPRTHRAIQKYCKRSELQWLPEDTTYGRRYRITPASVATHIDQLKQLKEANVREQSRPDANVRAEVIEAGSTENDGAPVREQTRPDANVRSPEDGPIASDERPRISANDIFDHPYVKRLEAEVGRLANNYEKQVRRTEEVLLDANNRLIELHQANAIASSETLAKYMLQLRAGSAAGADLDEAAE